MTNAQKYYYSYIDRNEGPGFHSLIVLSEKGAALTNWGLLPPEILIFDWNDTGVMTIEYNGDRCSVIEKMEAAGFSSSESLDAKCHGVSAKTCPEYLAKRQKEVLQDLVGDLVKHDKKHKL